MKDEWCCSAAWAAVRDSDAYNGEEKQFILDFLQRCKPQLYWKPSEKQMEVLWGVIKECLESDNENVKEIIGKVLESLYADLKKL